MYKEINELITKAKEGDESSKEELLKRLNPLIISSIKRYYNKSSEYEDLISEGVVVILECLKDHDESKGTHFLGYVKIMLKYFYLDKHKEKVIFSLNEPVGEEGEEELIDLLESKEMDILDKLIIRENTSNLKKALEELTIRQRDIIIYYYLERQSIHQISNRLNISYRTVVNTKTRALEKLQEVLKDGYKKEIN